MTAPAPDQIAIITLHTIVRHHIDPGGGAVVNVSEWPLEACGISRGRGAAVQSRSVSL
jgi:hypothetical protein